MKTYTLHVSGLTRELPICPVSDTLDIAAFIMLGDVELTRATARDLLAKCPDFDVLLTAECKGIPLAYEMSRQSGKRYILARKSKKLYMQDGIEITIKESITTGEIQKLYLSRHDADLLKGKRVGIIDDVVSTGNSLHGLEELVAKAGGTIAKKAFVLAEGDAAYRKDIVYLAKIPLL